MPEKRTTTTTMNVVGPIIKQTEKGRAGHATLVFFSFSFQDYGGRGILILRNPYAAILSDHNFLYAGHHGKAPAENYKRKGA